MEELVKRVDSLVLEISAAIERLKIEELSKQLAALKKESEASEFWSDNQKAQDIMRQIARLEGRVKPWQELDESLKEAKELLATKDTGLKKEIEDQIVTAEKSFEDLKQELKFTGPYDGGDAIISIYAGAGGTDAQDWARMLERMYLRWAEAHGLKTALIDESSGEEAGIKSATFEIEGSFVYGKLKGENGVHRLVRLSPFNADNLRQTSFSKVEVMPKIDKPEVIEIDEKDLKIDVYRSGGKGGQSVNTTDSAVRITHLPTNITVAIQNERSQLQNKETAMTILRSRLAQLQMEQHAEKISELKGSNEQAAWGNQIRSYVLHPYKQVKDLRTRHETSDAEGVLGGNLDSFIDAYLEYSFGVT